MRSNAQILRDAKDILTRYGWTQDWFGNCKTGFCAYGAVYYAAHGVEDCHEPTPTGAERFLEIAVYEISGDTSPAMYNDDPDTTIEDINRLFDRAIELAQEEDSE